jgi:uncharacterized protein YukE
MASADYDLGYLRAALDTLEDYLLSTEIYWPIGADSPAGAPDYPRLTLGGLLLAQKRAHAQDLSAEHRNELARIDEQIDALRSRWRVAWERKAGRGFSQRLRLWNDFIEDYRQNPKDNADRYNYEVERRVMLHLLGDEADAIPEAEHELLKGLDKLLGAVLIPDDFIWEQQLQSGFPRETYWYLYGRPRT